VQRYTVTDYVVGVRGVVGALASDAAMGASSAGGMYCSGGVGFQRDPSGERRGFGELSRGTMGRRNFPYSIRNRTVSGGIVNDRVDLDADDSLGPAPQGCDNLNAKLRVAIVIAILLLANLAMMSYAHVNSMPLRQELDGFPRQFDGWTSGELPPLTAREREVLKADDYLLRTYHKDGVSVALFVIYYESQRSGDALHSPKNCLPGAGWEPVKSGMLPVHSDKTFYVNHYEVAKSGQQQDILYWYQANKRIFASEYMGKIYLVLDAFLKHRTDGALIRVSVDRNGDDNRHLESAQEFAAQLPSILPKFLPQ
jgi:EpsI family protein